jgi:hypothetical protein
LVAAALTTTAFWLQPEPAAQSLATTQAGRNASGEVGTELPAHEAAVLQIESEVQEIRSGFSEVTHVVNAASAGAYFLQDGSDAWNRELVSVQQALTEIEANY